VWGGTDVRPALRIKVAARGADASFPGAGPNDMHDPRQLLELHLRTRLVFECGGLRHLGKLARELGGQRVLVVTDRGVAVAGHLARAEALLTAAGLAVAAFDAVHENPTTLDVDACVAAARAHEADLLIGLGGGSAMDTAKGANFLLTQGGAVRDFWGVGKATQPMLPFMAIPTTAGTGSEVQCAALIADAETHQKMACLDVKAAARIALLDPELTLTQPPRVTACTGLDALAHALEAAVTRERNWISDWFAREAFRRLWPAFPRVLAAPGDLAARGEMLLGAAFAGWAIEHSMLGAAHALANPLTAHCGLIHGHAVGLVLPHVVRFNAGARDAAATYEELARASGLPPGTSLADALGEPLALAGLGTRLRDCGVMQAGLPALAAEAGQQWTARFNPRPVAAAELQRLYEAAW
jgi:alcohol dehydrogenase